MYQPVSATTVGDPDRFLPLDALLAGLAALPPAPVDVGRLRGLVRRGEGGLRETPASAALTVEGGLEGDAWGRREHRRLDEQLAVMQHDVNALISNGQPLTLAGDNLLVDLDLSAASLPIGSLLSVGAALLVVTPKAHNGCSKFRARFGGDALKLVADPTWRHLNLRGVYLRVVASGVVAVGDPIVVRSRPSHED